MSASADKAHRCCLNNQCKHWEFPFLGKKIAVQLPTCIYWHTDPWLSLNQVQKQVYTYHITREQHERELSILSLFHLSFSNNCCLDLAETWNCRSETTFPLPASDLLPPSRHPPTSSMSGIALSACQAENRLRHCAAVMFLPVRPPMGWAFSSPHDFKKGWKWKAGKDSTEVQRVQSCPRGHVQRSRFEFTVLFRHTLWSTEQRW